MNSLEAILSSALIIWEYVKEDVYLWLSLIAILIFLLIVFRCYRKTISIAEDRLKRMEQTLKRLTLSKKVPSRKRIRKMHSSFVRIERLIQASLYDNPSDALFSEALRLVSSADRAINALTIERLQQNSQAAHRVLKNAYSLIIKAADSLA